MPWRPPPHISYRWHDKPATDTPLDHTHLEAAEDDLKAYAQEIGGIIGTGATPVADHAASPVSVAAGDLVPVDISGGDVVLNLPLAPPDQQRVGIKVVKVSGTPGSTSATVNAAAGQAFDLVGGATDLVLSALQGVALQYDEVTAVWHVSSDVGNPLSVVTDSSASPKDIDSTGIANGDVLAYDVASGKLKPGLGGVPVVDVSKFATAGSGTWADPWTGWETALTAAIANATIFWIPGIFKTATHVSFDGTRNVRLLGPGTKSLSAFVPSAIAFTGGGYMSAASSWGFTVEGVDIYCWEYQHSLPSVLTGFLLDIAGAFGATLNRVLFGIDYTAIGLNLNGAVECSATDTTFEGGLYGLEGVPNGSGTASTTFAMLRGRFQDQITAAIHNPMEMYSFADVIFEPTNGGTDNAIVRCDADVFPLVLNFDRCWCRDGSAGTLFLFADWVQGFNVRGCVFVGTTIFSVQDASGICIEGNEIMGGTIWATPTAAPVGQLKNVHFAGNDTNHPGAVTDNTRALVAQGYIIQNQIAPRVVAVTQSATPAIDTDLSVGEPGDSVVSITGLAQAITSMTTNLTGTPADGDRLVIRITDNGTARAITWGTKFEASTVALPTTTVISTLLWTEFIWNAATSKWRIIRAV